MKDEERGSQIETALRWVRQGQTLFLKTQPADPNHRFSGELSASFENFVAEFRRSFVDLLNSTSRKQHQREWSPSIQSQRQALQTQLKS